MKENEIKGYLIPSITVNPEDMICENFFDAVDIAVRQIFKEQGIDYDKINKDKMNVCITKSYVVAYNSKRIHQLIKTDGKLFSTKFYRTVIVNMEG